MKEIGSEHIFNQNFKEKFTLPFLKKDKDTKFDILKHEVDAYCKRIIKNIQLSKKVIEDSRLTQEEKVLIMKDRFGLPEQLSLKLLV